jgi:phage gp46-like protein
MADVRIVSKFDWRETIADWLHLPNGLLDESEELANYAKVALMTDRLSEPTEIRPDPDSDDRKGWWGDYQAAEIHRGWPIGTKNWLLTRAKINDAPSFEGNTVMRAEMYTREALQPLVDMRMCTAIDVKAARVDIDRIDVGVVIYRGNKPEVALLFQDLWNQLRSVAIESPYGGSV